MNASRPRIVTGPGVVAAASSAALVVSLVLSPGIAQAADVRTSLGNFLRHYLDHPADRPARYSFSLEMLNDETPSVVVYLNSHNWCGSGGCTAILLQPVGSSFKVIDRFTLVHLPIRILPTKTNGWKNIVMRVQGGGILPGYFAILRFDGRRYPTNPSVAPKLAAEIAATGTILSLNEHGSIGR